MRAMITTGLLTLLLITSVWKELNASSNVAENWAVRKDSRSTPSTAYSVGFESRVLNFYCPSVICDSTAGFKMYESILKLYLFSSLSSVFSFKQIILSIFFITVTCIL